MKKINMYTLKRGGEVMAVFKIRHDMYNFILNNNITGGTVTFKNFNMTINRFINQHAHPAMYLNNRLKSGVLNE